MIRDDYATAVLFEDEVRAFAGTFSPSFAPKPVDRFSCRHATSSCVIIHKEALRFNGGIAVCCGWNITQIAPKSV
jgi:hypothetical protein